MMTLKGYARRVSVRPCGWSAAFAFLLLLPMMLGATTWYLSPSGSDSNAGTQSQPFRTVAHGITAANPGDTILLADGDYPGDTPWGGGSTTGYLLMINKSGVPGAPITIQAEHQGMATLDCGNTFNGSQTGCDGYIYFWGGAAYWVVDGVVFANEYVAGIDMNDATPAHDITVEHCTFTQIGQHYSTDDFGYEGVYAGPGQYNLTFTGNTFNNIGRTGGLYISHDHGLYLHASNSTITNNIFHGPITGWGVQTAAGFSGLIANNTFAFNMNNNGGQIMLWDVAGGAITIQNNIFYNPNDGFAINNCGLQSPSVVVDHNLVTNGTIGGADTCGGGMTITPTNTSYADPMFVNGSTAPYNFYYQSGSPAINTGITVSQVPVDMAGTLRPQENIYDLGAYEYIFGNTPPAISGVAAANITASSATITWTTNQASNAQVEYGVTPAYGTSTSLNSNMVMQHSVNLAGLAPGTTYDYAVMSSNSNNNQATSGNFTFTTAAATSTSAFSLTASAGGVAVTQGQAGTDTITVSLVSGTAQPVALSVAGAPSGVTASLSSASCTPACSSTLTLTVGSSVMPGSYSLTVNGSSGAHSASVALTLGVLKAFSFSLSANSASLSIAQGGSAADKITASLSYGTPAAVSFSLAGLPAGVSSSYSTESCTPSCSSTATITVGRSVAPGTYKLTAKASGNGVAATTAITLTITSLTSNASMPTLAGYWPFGEGSGSIANDSTGNGATGTLRGGVEWEPTPWGHGLQFNGTSSYVSVVDAASLNLSGALTISFWINGSDVPGVDQRIVSKNFDWDVKLNGATHAPQFTAAPYYATMDYSLPMGSWHMITFTLSSGTVAGYADGATQSMSYYTFPSSFTLPATAYGMNFGADSSESNFMKGTLDDVRLYSQALSPAQVSELYSQTKHS
jgi:hypothetical protein